MKARTALLTIVLVVGVMAGGGTYLQRVIGVRRAAATPGGAAPSGAWFCPHGGGPKGWTAALSLANPGTSEVRARVETLSRSGGPAVKDVTVPPSSTVRVTVPADSRERASVVEYFGGWIAAGWAAVAGGSESGVAAEPCLPQAGRRWLLPDGTTAEGQEAFVIVMNPFAAPAVFSLNMFTEQREVSPKEWSDFVLPPGRSLAFHLNDKDLGDRTVATVITVSVGRVAAASLGVADQGGVRSAVGIAGPAAQAVLPGGGDSGRTEVPVFDPGGGGVAYGVSLLGPQARQPAPGLADEQLGPSADRTYDLTVASPSAVVVSATGGEGAFVAARRTFGPDGHDQGSTVGVPPGRAFMLVPAAASHSDRGALFLTNPGSTAVHVRLLELGHGGATETATVPPGTTVAVPAAFVTEHPLDAVLAEATDGTFVPAEVSNSANGVGYSVAAGVPIPGHWVPR